ncbi:AMP-binding-domain-containing protein [Schizophyllum commune Tattone D]|nr:AMP-binding-domain-containing protein [Schizophyllum commune Tattone D]
MYVMDSHQRLVPPGMIGTMYIASEVLARGYTEERLNEAFYPASKITKAWGLTPSPGDRRRFFRSSDQARWLCATGQLEYMGRNDTEVNIRGQRVDLAGVDHALRKSTEILDAVTVIQHDPQGAALLVSFVVPKFNAKVDKAGDLTGAEQSPTDVLADVGDSIEFETKLKDTVSAILPSYMIPSFIVPLSQFPQTITGKIDRKTLTSWTHLVDYARDADGSTTVGGDESASAVEEIIIEIFKEVLQRKQVRADNSFFHLGGHSLLATQVISRIRKALGVDDRLTVRALFDAPTAGALAQLVESLQDQDFNKSDATPAIAISYQPIERLGAHDAYTLSYAQERLYFLDVLHPGQTGYIIPHVLRIGGALDIQALRAAFRHLRQRHEMLRVTYEDNNGVIVQRIHDCDEQELLVVDLTANAKPDDTLQKMLQADNDASLDLHKDLPLRFKLYRLGPDTHVLWMALHHLSTDAWSDRVIQRELGQLYVAYHTGLPATLPDLPITYMDYAAWQRQPDQSVRQEEQLKYWVDTLQGSVPAEFPTDFVRPSALSARAGLERIDILGEDAIALERFAASMNSTPFIVLLSALRTLHYRLTGVEDATLGNPIANRNRMELEGVVGFFVNTQSMRIPLEGKMSFRQLCEHVRTTAAAAYEAQDIAFERIVHELQPARDLSRNPIVQVMIAVHPEEDSHLGDDEGGALEVQQVDVEPVTRFDLEFHFVKMRNGEGYDGRLLYSRDLYTPDSAARLSRQFKAILRQAIEAEEKSVGADMALDEFIFPDVVNSLEQFGLLDDTSCSYPSDKGLGELFRMSALAHADCVAVKDATCVVSYKELDALSDRVARHLLSLRLAPETFVGLLCARSVHYIAAIIGILKAGLAYLPLDPQLPRDRMVTLLNDIPRHSVVYHDASLAELDTTGMGPDFVDVHAVLSDTSAQDLAEASVVDVNGRNLAYAMYTSGSTGKPKAVLIEQRSIARLAYSQSVVEPRRGQVWAHISNTAFDSSTWEIWAPLLNGGTVVCFDKMTVLDFDLLEEAFKVHGVDVAFLTTALAAKCLHETPSIIKNLEVLATGGETCDPRDLTAMSEMIRGYVAHVYGPTESTT